MSNVWSQLKPANFDKWARRDLWTLPECAFLLKGKEPVRGSEPYKVEEFVEFYKDLERSTGDAERVGSLVGEVSAKDENFLTSRKYRPPVFLIWAESKGYEIPKGLQSLLSNKGKDEELDPRERNTFLRIIAVLSKQTGINLDNPYKAAEAVHAMAATHEIEMPKKVETTAKKLKATKMWLESQ